MNKMKNAIETINIKTNQAEGRICELPDKNLEIIQSEENKEKRMKENEESLCDLCNTIKRRNLQIIGVAGEEMEEGAENLFKEIMMDTFPNLGRDLDIQVNEAHRSPNKLNLKIWFRRHIKIKMSKSKDKERILKATRKKKL